MDKFGEPARQQQGGTPGPVQVWGPAPFLASATLLAMLGSLAWRLLDPDPENRLVATVLVVVFAVATLALVRIRSRLRAGSDGIAVTGPLRTRNIPWGRIDSISAPRRGRFGRHAAILEIEVRPDDELLTFGRFDLGADPAEVCRALLRHRRSAGH